MAMLRQKQNVLRTSKSTLTGCGRTGGVSYPEGCFQENAFKSLDPFLQLINNLIKKTLDWRNYCLDHINMIM